MSDSDEKGDEKADTLRVVAEGPKSREDAPPSPPKPVLAEPPPAPRRAWWTWPAALLGAVALVLGTLVVARIAERAPEVPTVVVRPGAPPRAETPADAGADASAEEPQEGTPPGPTATEADEADAGDVDAGDASIASEAHDGGDAGDAGDDGGALAGSAGRTHFQEGAVGWRVSGGDGSVLRTSRHGAAFDVWLRPGATFEGIRVEWQDASGHWHVH